MSDRRSSGTAAVADPRGRIPAPGLIGLAGIAALVFGALLPTEPLLALGLLALLPLALGAPVTSLGALLFVTTMVPSYYQNRFSLVGGEDVPGLLMVDLLLLAALCRVGVLVLSGRLKARAPLLLAGALGLLLAAALAGGIASGADVSEAGHEARRVALGVGAFLVAWPIVGDPAARRRLYWVLLALGLGIGAVGIAQWLFSVDFASAGDSGVRPGVDETSGGRGQLQYALYAYPVAVTLSYTALVSGRIRSLEARWLLGAIFLLNAVALLLTFERTFWAATAVACGVATLASGGQARQTAARWVPLGAVVLLITLAGMGELRTAAERLASVADYSTDVSLEHRRVETRAVLEEIKDHPLTGSGFGSTITWGVEDVFAFQTSTYAHNGYLWLAWKTGLPTAALIVLLIALAAFWPRPGPRDTHLAILRTGSQAALFGLLLTCVTFPAFNTYGITAVMGLMVAVCLQRDPSPPPGRGDTRGPTQG